MSFRVTNIAARRDACLETWANVKHRDDVDLVFILGDGQSPWPVREGCLLHCPCPDDYDSLSMKTRWLCLWAIGTIRSTSCSSAMTIRTCMSTVF